MTPRDGASGTASATLTPPASASSEPTALGGVKAIVRQHLLQSARKSSSPWLLMSVLLLLAVVTTGAGAMLSTRVDPADLGSSLFQLFFALAFFAICSASAALGAASLSAETTRGTWEQLVLSAVPVRRIALSKLLAVGVQLGHLLLALVPFGAVPYLFGGVQLVEIALGFLWLAALGVLAACFGLWLGSVRASRFAPTVAAGSALALGVVAFAGLGLLGSSLARYAWPELPSNAPVWLPLAYTHAERDLAYWVTLVVAPLGSVVLLASGLFELAVLNLAHAERRGFWYFKRWGLGAICALLGIAYVVRVWIAAKDQLWIAPACSMLAITLLASWLLRVLMAETWLLPARLTLGQSFRLRAWLAPGLTRSAAFALTLCAAGLGLGWLLAVAGEGLGGRLQGAALGTYATALVLIALSMFSLACAHAGVVLYARANGSVRHARRRSALALGLILLGPWLVAAVAAFASGRLQDGGWIAAASPGYSWVIAAELSQASLPATRTWALHLSADLLWLILGFSAWRAAQRKLRSQSPSTLKTRAKPTTS